MQGGEKLSLEQIRAFWAATEEAQFDGQSTAEVYAWVTRVLQQHGYNNQKRAVKGLLRLYVAKMTGLSRAQTARLIGQYAACCEVKMKAYSRHRFASRFDRSDIELLARVDEAHESLNGPATKEILQREFQEFGRAEYESLASISPAVAQNGDSGQGQRA